jgi:hypothetical protein
MSYFRHMVMSWLNRLVVGVLFVFTSSICEAQAVNLSDSLKGIFKTKPSPSLKLDSRNSFVTGQSARMAGIKAGVSFKKTMIVGFGYSWLLSDLKQPTPVGYGFGESRVNMRYFGPFVEYSYFRKYPWESIVCANIGYGYIFLRPTEGSSKEKIWRTNAFVYEPSMAIDYKIGGWVAVGVGLGYRLVMRGSKDIEQNFTAPVYVLRFRILFDKIEPIIRKELE